MFDFCNLSPRGYTVVKEKLTSNQIQEIRKDLTVKPFVNTDFGAQSQPFAVYGESARKLYIPRFYGIAKFGDPYISKLDAPEEVDVSFTKELRPIQRPQWILIWPRQPRNQPEAVALSRCRVAERLCSR